MRVDEVVTRICGYGLWSLQIESLMTTEFWTDPITWCLIALFAAAVAMVVRERQRRLELHKQHEESQANSEEQAQAVQLAADEAVRTAEERMNHSLQAVMRTLQVSASNMQRVLSEGQFEFENAEVLRFLLRLDHISEQVTRRVQAVAVLSGGYLGRRRREPASVYNVIRGAVGRIQDYKRVNLLPPPHDYAVLGRYVEPLAAAFAELLDNATRYSTGTTPIDVDIRPVGTGVCVTIDDGGIGMTDEERERAAGLLSGSAETNIFSLGDPPKIGFALIGELAKKEGFQVSVDRTSAYGGVRAVVLIPDELLTSVPLPQQPEPQKLTLASAEQATNPEELAGVGAPAEGTIVREASHSETSEPAVIGHTSGGLPMRRRFSGTPTVVPEPTPAPYPQGNTVPLSSARPRSSGLGAWQRGSARGRADRVEGEDREEASE